MRIHPKAPSPRSGARPRLGLLLALALLLPVPVAAAPATAKTYGGLTQSERIDFIQAAIANGDIDLAARLLRHSRFNEGDLGYKAAYLQAVVLRGQGRAAEAEALLRKILTERPEFDLVRQELAVTMMAQGNAQGARYHLRLLADAARDPDMRGQFEDFIDRMDGGRQFRAGGFISIAPDSNFNNGSDHEVIYVNGIPFVIDGTSRARSGIGLIGGVNASYTHDLTESLSAYTAGSVTQTLYRESAYNNTTGDIRFGLSWKEGATQIAAESIFDRRWYAGDPYDYGMGGRIYGRAVLSPQFVYSGELRVMNRHYDDRPDAGRTNLRATGKLSYIHRPYEIYSLELGAERENVPRQSFNSFTGGFAEAGVQKELPFGINAGFFVKLGVQDYDSDFPGMREARQDTSLRLSATFLKRDFSYAGFTPRLGLTYYRQWSNVSLYDYDKYGMDITLTRDF